MNLPPDLSHNRLTILPDNIFMGLSSLLTLDLSHNPIRANFKELFHYTQQLRTLRLSQTGLQAVPALPLPGLLSLDLSNNRLQLLDSAALERLGQLRELQISHNKEYGIHFDGLRKLIVICLNTKNSVQSIVVDALPQLASLPAHCWRFIPLLNTLDISFNPIRVLTKESFYGLQRLQKLLVHDLPDLKRFDADSLTQLTYLSRLYIQSWPGRSVTNIDGIQLFLATRKERKDKLIMFNACHQCS